MKKFVFASVLAMASLSLIPAATLRAQDSITIKDPAEYNAFQLFNTQTDPKAKAAAGESFVTTYAQSVVKTSVLSDLVDAYQQLGDNDKTLSAASRLLQADTNNMKAVLVSVYIRKTQCSRTADVQACSEAGLLAKKGLTLTKPADVADADWKTQVATANPIFHSAIALDAAIGKKDFKTAAAEFTAELALYTDEQSKTAGLADTLQLAQVYTQAETKDLVKAIWFYARAWDFAPAGYKPTIEKSLNYFYKKYHGDLKGLDDIKAKAALTTFPGDLKIEAAKTPAEQIHDLIASTPDLKTLALADKETVLALGSKEDAEKLWALLKGEQSPVPGVVTDVDVTSLKVTLTVGVKPTEITVALKTPIAVKDIVAAGADEKANLDYIVANGVKEDADKVVAAGEAKKLSYEPQVTVIKVAVTQDAKDAKTPDFIVNLKTPISVKEAPAVGFEYKTQPAAELDGTYDTYTQIPATATTAQAAQIVLKDAFIQSAKKAPAAPAHKPAAGHKAR